MQTEQILQWRHKLPYWTKQQIKVVKERTRPIDRVEAIKSWNYFAGDRLYYGWYNYRYCLSNLVRHINPLVVFPSAQHIICLGFGEENKLPIINDTLKSVPELFAPMITNTILSVLLDYAPVIEYSWFSPPISMQDFSNMNKRLIEYEQSLLQLGARSIKSELDFRLGLRAN